MKSAFELAMERLQAEEPQSSRPLTNEQKEALADIDRRFQAKIAEREVFLLKQCDDAHTSGDADAVAQIETQLKNERARLREECETAKEKIRHANP